MEELEQKADELIKKHLPFARTWDCYWDEPSEEKNDIKSAIQSVNYTIGVLERSISDIADLYDKDVISIYIDEQIELKKILEGRL